MARFIERTVQEIAQDYLRDKYRRKARHRRIYSDIEVRTKPKFGSKRADGFLAFQHWLMGTYVVSMEAKSYKTLPAMTPKIEPRLFLFNCLRAGFIITMLTGTLFVFLKGSATGTELYLPVGVLVSGGFFYGILTRKSFSHKVVDVIQQVKQYPANEYWLAFSEDSLDSLRDERVNHLVEISRNLGIGILIVKPGGQVEERLRARRHWKWFGDYLKFYSVEQQVREKLVA